MDKLRGKNTSKQAKSSKKKAVKVVYISNPMKVKTSASDFRALVQELTGQDSDIADASRYSEMDDDIDEGSVIRTNDEGSMMMGNDNNSNGAIKEETTTTTRGRVDPIKSLDSTFDQFEAFDRVFSPYMQDNGFTPSGLLYDVPAARTIIKKT
ncbi:hypothetical protein FRX31_007041 [Thalictrum thalictroides]|uniref:VQ domain-containing protein n=1 Tax=Thalictrum thalictroides TaxID=46969 RepID=A0A7J6X4T4_THATH|nr:hypothetical protein FRX31_007041 [Thalictrum thalictroides]